MDWQPTPIFLPGELQDWAAWRATAQGVARSQTQLSIAVLLWLCCIYAVSPPHPLSYRETLKLCSLMYPRITRTVPGTQYVSKSTTFFEWINDFSTQHPRCFYHPGFLPPSLCPFSNLNLPNSHFLSLWCSGFWYFQPAESRWRKITEACRGDPPQNHIAELICDFNHD